MYILLITIIAWVLFNPISKAPEELCSKKKISHFASQIDQHHWYFHSYLNLKKYNNLKQTMANLNCNLAKQYQKIRLVNQKPKIIEIYMIGINQ